MMFGVFQRKKLIKHLKNILEEMLQLDKSEYSPYVLGKLEGMVIQIEQNLKGKDINDIYGFEMVYLQNYHH